MTCEFLIPVSRDDLLRKTSVNQYTVEEVHSRSRIPAAVQEFKQACRNKPFAAVDHFDTVFSVLVVRRDLDNELVEEAWLALLRVCKLLQSALSAVLEDVDIPAESRQRHMMAVKMTLYLLCQFIEMWEAEACQANPIMVKKGRGRAAKQQTKSGMDWDREREEGVQTLVHMLQLHLHKLWDPPIPEEDFVSMVSSCLYKLLENPSVASARCKETRDAICHGIGALVKRYNHALSASLKIAQMLKHFEHLVSPMAQLVEVIVNNYGNKSVVGDIMREIGRMDPRDAARDTSGARAYSQFLVEVGEKVPAAVLPNVSVVLSHLDEESYTLRNGVLGMMGEILIRILSKEGLDSPQKVARDGFFDRLQDHIHDMHAFVRSKVLQIWLNIVNEKCLPLPRQETLVRLVLGRLQDVSSQVRRYAIQLLTAVLKCNPFAAKLSVEELLVSYEKEEARLKEMMPDDSISASVSAERSSEELEEEWQRILPMVTEALAAADDEDSGNDDAEGSTAFAEDDTCPSVLDRVYTLVVEEQYSSALFLLKAAYTAWPDSDVFHCQLAETIPADEDSEMQSTEKESDFDILGALRNVFYEHRSPDLAKITEAATNSSSQCREGESPEVNELSKQQVLVQYLKDSLAFARQIQEAVPILCQLLGSKNTSDVFEAVEFFVTSYEFGVSAALQGVRRMLVLVWSKEQSVKDAVVAAYKRLYLESTAGSQRNRALSVVKNLSMLIHGASCGDLTSLEALMGQLMQSGELSSQVIQVLWERFTLKIPDTCLQDSRAALLLISMVAGAEPNIVHSNLDVLIEEGLGPRADGDQLLAQAACQALLKLATKKKKGQTTTEPFRLPPDHRLFSRLTELLVTGMQKESKYWVPLGEQGVTLIYRLADQPDSVCGDIIQRMASILQQEIQAMGSDSNDGGEISERISGMLTKLLALSGQVALQQLVHMEVGVLGELKRRNALQEDHQSKKNKASKRQSTAGSVDEEMGLAGASADDAEAEYIRKLCEKDIVSGHNLLATLQPLLVAVCTNQGRYPHPELRTAATLALAKFMTVSSEFCEEHLQLMFTIMEKSPSEVIRANSIIAVGDLTFRFPNLIEPWTPHLYGRLRDPSRLVRKYTLQVLTHLILNDMVKVKGQISELASCIVDGDDQIAGLAKLFFHELAKKGNALYNILPDAISRLSDPEIGVEEDHFQVIMKYMFSFIQKDKLCESLVEKLCHRYRATVSERQWRDLSYCLSLLSYSEKSLRKLQENFSCFADKMVDENVYACFTSIIAKSRGGFAKPEAKVLVDELEERLEQCHRKGLDEGETALRASKSSNAAQQHSKRGLKTSARSAKTPEPLTGRRRGRGKENVEENEESPVARRPTRRKGGKSKPVFESDDEDEDDMLFDVDENDESECLNANSPVASRSRGGKVPLGQRA
ncbi:condensin complex subunit 1-like isoform X3 [Babylonia areolata]